MAAKDILLTKSSKSAQSTTIRISLATKERMENLSFVRKHTFDEIILELIRGYEKGGKK